MFTQKLKNLCISSYFLIYIFLFVHSFTHLVSTFCVCFFVQISILNFDHVKKINILKSDDKQYLLQCVPLLIKLHRTIDKYEVNIYFENGQAIDCQGSGRTSCLIFYYMNYMAKMLYICNIFSRKYNNNHMITR